MFITLPLLELVAPAPGIERLFWHVLVAVVQITVLVYLLKHLMLTPVARVFLGNYTHGNESSSSSGSSIWVIT